MTTTLENPKKSTQVAVADDPRWARIVARDRAADGQFWYSVITTGVYCRPSCPSRTANPQNVQLHDTLAAAKATGFRPCRRCNPDGPSIDGENAAIMQHMVQSICVYGIPFMKANADLNSVLDTLLLARYSIRQDYTLPVAYLLSGKPQEARACVTKYVNTLGKDPAAQDYRRFAANLLKRLAN